MLSKIFSERFHSVDEQSINQGTQKFFLTPVVRFDDSKKLKDKNYSNHDTHKMFLIFNCNSDFTYIILIEIIF